ERREGRALAATVLPRHHQPSGEPPQDAELLPILVSLMRVLTLLVVHRGLLIDDLELDQHEPDPSLPGALVVLWRRQIRVQPDGDIHHEVQNALPPAAQLVRASLF